MEVERANNEGRGGEASKLGAFPLDVNGTRAAPKDVRYLELDLGPQERRKACMQSDPGET